MNHRASESTRLANPVTSRPKLVFGVPWAFARRNFTLSASLVCYLATVAMKKSHKSLSNVNNSVLER